MRCAPRSGGSSKNAAGSGLWCLGLESNQHLRFFKPALAYQVSFQGVRIERAEATGFHGPLRLTGSTVLLSQSA